MTDMAGAVLDRWSKNFFLRALGMGTTPDWVRLSSMSWWVTGMGL